MQQQQGQAPPPPIGPQQQTHSLGVITDREERFIKFRTLKELTSPLQDAFNEPDLV